MGVSNSEDVKQSLEQNSGSVKAVMHDRIFKAEEELGQLAETTRWEAGRFSGRDTRKICTPKVDHSCALRPGLGHTRVHGSIRRKLFYGGMANGWPSTKCKNE